MKDIWFIIFSIGIAQGLFLIISLLLLKEKRKLSIRLLLLLILCTILLLSREWLTLLIPLERVIFIFRTVETLPLLIGPLFWMYIVSIINPDFKITKKQLFHFLPFAFFLLLFLPFYLQSNEYKLQYLEEWDNNPLPLGFVILGWFKGLHALTYLIASWYCLRRYHKNNPERVKNRFNTGLLYKLIIFQVIFVSIIHFVLALEFNETPLPIEPDHVAALLVTFSFFIYAFAIVIFPQTVVPEDENELKKSRYQASSLQSEEKQEILEKLKKSLEEDKAYLNPNLTIGELSAEIGVNSNRLSQVINELLGKSFIQLINEYRINEVKENISNTSKTLYGIALDSGFNSKSAFNRSFKEVTGMTPSEYKKSLEK
ncbi:helix-turn-helix domain-containing protein [Leptobacterium flavescens]|uniref:Helix-turn-helix domain-containing protein n=1 Tax=Leptobacterium flavescens TaxID=472055 RepID=A0A6P0UJN9_9FLAO|nr:AraC family transcriptional regulator [Leptobacterium flavescens]NER13581.1 helix-turn-helix domain-containing protein [Leptobacterium flavescens]